METSELQSAQRSYETGIDSAERVACIRNESSRKTLAAKQAMRAIRNLTERDCCELICAIHARISESGFGHSETAEQAIEYLMDAHAVLETEAEIQEGEL